MPQKLFTVDDVFKIAGRGTVVAGNRPPDLPDFRIGSKIILVQPEGKELAADIGGFEIFSTISGFSKKIADG